MGGPKIEERVLERYHDLDTQVAEAAKSIKILSNLTWPAGLCAEFLAQWERGKPALPRVEFLRNEYRDATRHLKSILAKCDRSEPVENYIAETAESYITAAAMLGAVGTPSFTELSTQLYGSPHHPGGAGTPIRSVDGRAVADHVIARTAEFSRVLRLPPEEGTITPEAVAEAVRRAIKPVFREHPVRVVVDPSLSAKATAGAQRIRIRGGAPFFAVDVPEIIHHEAFVHTLTMINGRAQPLLPSLGLGAPRTTFAQEGLALFAEFITHSIDLGRLRRIALRLKAIERGLDGADFIDLFKFFLEHGQAPHESFHSTMRIFRGGDVRGRVVNTKDVVYLQGFLAIHAFFIKAIQAGKLDYPHILFAGRMALRDVVTFESLYHAGALRAPLYEPDWVKNRACLVAFLLHSSIVDELDLDRIQLEDLILPATRIHGGAARPLQPR